MTKLAIVLLLAAYLLPVLYICFGALAGRRVTDMVAAFYIAAVGIAASMLFSVVAAISGSNTAAFSVMMLNLILLIIIMALTGWRVIRLLAVRQEYSTGFEADSDLQATAVEEDALFAGDSPEFLMEVASETTEIGVKNCTCDLKKNGRDSLPKDYYSGVKSDSLLSPNWYLWVFRIKYRLSSNILTVEAEASGVFSPWTDIFTPWSAASLKRKAVAMTSGSASCTSNSKDECIATGVSSKNLNPDHEFSAAVVINAKKDLHGNKHIINLAAEAATAVAGQVAIQSLGVAVGTGSNAPVQVSGQLTINVPKGANDSQLNSGEVQFRCDKVCRPSTT